MYVVRVCLQVEYKLLTSLNALNIVQSLIIFFGMAAGLSVCARVSSWGPLQCLCVCLLYIYVLLSLRRQK